MALPDANETPSPLWQVDALETCGSEAPAEHTLTAYYSTPTFPADYLQMTVPEAPDNAEQLMHYAVSELHKSERWAIGALAVVRLCREHDTPKRERVSATAYITGSSDIRVVRTLHEDDLNDSGLIDAQLRSQPEQTIKLAVLPFVTGQVMPHGALRTHSTNPDNALHVINHNRIFAPHYDPRPMAW